MTRMMEAQSGSNAASPLDWSEKAPAGGRATMKRLLSDGAAEVPLFLAQTFVKSLRDVGYNDTVSAVCEHVDNAIQWGAGEIRVYFRQQGTKGSYRTDVLVYDDGVGMAPDVLRVAMSFGGSMVYDRRTGIGRFGVGMKTAALAMAPTLEVFSWQEPGSIYQMELDVEEIGSRRQDALTLDEPVFMDSLPFEIATILSEAMSYPKRDAQVRLVERVTDLPERLPSSGTIVFIPSCDRLSFKTAQTLSDHATKDMARIYRRQLADGLRLYVNNRLLEPFDPTYWMEESRTARIKGLTPNRSRLVGSWKVEIPTEENGAETAPATVRLYALPLEQWQQLDKKTLQNDLRVYSGELVSFMRNDREVDAKAVPEISGRVHADTHWLRVEIDFDGRLDEAFGVAMTKQGTRLKEYARDRISDVIGDSVSRLRKQNAQIMSANRLARSVGKLSEAERRAAQADPFQREMVPALTVEEERQLDEQLRVLARRLRRGEETVDDAFERIKASKYIVATVHDVHWPFYVLDYECGRVILTINTAHPFYVRLYHPLALLADGAEGSGLLVALELVLLSLGSTQARLTRGDEREEARQLFTAIQRDWSDTLKTQLELE